MGLKSSIKLAVHYGKRRFGKIRRRIPLTKSICKEDMKLYRTTKMKRLGTLCRTCMNKEYHLKLQPKDCMYFMYRYQCQRCGKVQNIVRDIRPLLKWKIYLHHKQHRTGRRTYSL